MWTTCKSLVQSFYESEAGDIVMHVIKTGFDNKYYIVFDDACEQISDTLHIDNRENIERLYGVKIHI